jgi:hypothetical protein
MEDLSSCPVGRQLVRSNYAFERPVIDQMPSHEREWRPAAQRGR